MEQEQFEEFLETGETEKDVTVKVTLNDPTRCATINAVVAEREWRLLKLIIAKPTITYTELAEKLKSHRATIAEDIKFLIGQKVLSRVRTDKGGMWKVNVPLQDLF